MIPAGVAADELRAARLARLPRAPFTDTDPTLDEQWGYQVQDRDRARRLADGERLIGAKLGLTSIAKQKTMGVHQPIVGFLTDALHLPDDRDHTLLSRTAQARIEPEIAFRLGRKVDRPLTARTAAQAIDGIAAAMEIIDSRYAGFGFRLPDVVADNTSAAGFRLGPWTSATYAADLATTRCAFTAAGRVVGRATGAAVLGDPLLALMHLSEHAASRGESLPAGSIVLAGALTDAVPIRSGVRYRAEIEGLGSVDFEALMVP